MYQANEKLIKSNFREAAIVAFTKLVTQTCATVKAREVTNKSYTREFDLSKVYIATWSCIWNKPSIQLKQKGLYIIQKNDQFALVGVIGEPIIESINYIYRLEDLQVTDETVTIG
jgi:hypothetical protein